MTSQRYTVLTLCGNDYENVWENDGEPEIFDSYEEAEIAILEHISICTSEALCGNLADAPTRDQFIIQSSVE